MDNRIIVNISNNISEEIPKEIISSLRELDYEVEINKKEPTGPWAFWEYLIPPAIVFIVSSYFSGFFKEFGALTAKSLIQAVKKDYNKLNEPNPRIISNYDAELLNKELEKLRTEGEKKLLLKTHKYGKPANLIAFESKSNSHQFTARYVLPSGLTDENIEQALSSLTKYSSDAENYLIFKQSVFDKNGSLRKDNPSKFNDVLIQNGYTINNTTVFYYSLEKSNWINTETYLIKSLKSASTATASSMRSN